MTSEQFHDALTLLPEDLVARADEFRSRKPKVIPLKRYAALAACFVVLLTSALAVHALRQKSAVTEMAAAAPFSAMRDTEAVAAESPRMEAAKEIPETSRSAATADSAIPFTCVETPYNPHNTACYAHGPAPYAMASREELDDYLSKWDRLYLLAPLRDACQIYDEAWFASHDLILIPVDCVTGSCTVTDMTIADGGCEITVDISGDQAEESTNYHILLPLEKNNLTDPANITVIYNSDTTD